MVKQTAREFFLSMWDAKVRKDITLEQGFPTFSDHTSFSILTDENAPVRFLLTKYCNMTNHSYILL